MYVVKPLSFEYMHAQVLANLHACLCACSFVCVREVIIYGLSYIDCTSVDRNRVNNCLLSYSIMFVNGRFTMLYGVHESTAWLCVKPQQRK